MTRWRRIPYRCTVPRCDGLAVWLDPDGEPRCTMHGPPTEKAEADCCEPASEGEERHRHDLCEHPRCPDWDDYE